MGEPKQVTIRDIAAKLGISCSTVSRALSKNPEVQIALETQKKVLNAAKSMGYPTDRIDRSVAKQKPQPRSPRRATIQDIAKKAGVSQSTVSRALSGNSSFQVKPETRQQVLEVADAMWYQTDLLARAMATRRTATLGLVTYRISNPLNAQFIQEIMREAHLLGYGVVLGMADYPESVNPWDNEQVHIRQLVSRGVDGLLIHTRRDVDEAGAASRIIDAVRDAVPVATFSYPIEGLNAVVLDREKGIHDLTSHLIDLGHQHIGFVGGNWDLHLPETAKTSGYLRAVEEHGLNPEQIFADSRTLEEGYELGLEFGGRSGASTALICPNDLWAMGVCRGLVQTGVRVPEDVAVVGYGGIEIGAYFIPSLTSVATPVSEISREVVQLLIDQLEGETKVRQVTVDSQLVIRESCGAGRK